jgi:hypothetical protein
MGAMTNERLDDEPRREPDEQRFPGDEDTTAEPVRAPIDESASAASASESGSG